MANFSQIWLFEYELLICTSCKLVVDSSIVYIEYGANNKATETHEHGEPRIVISPSNLYRSKHWDYTLQQLVLIICMQIQQT